MNSTRAAYLFQRYFGRTATAEERAELMAWIGADENAEGTEALMNKAWEEFKDTEAVFTPEQSEEMLRRILLKEHLPVPPLMRRKSARIRWLRIAAAAAVLALLATGAYFRYASERAGTLTAHNDLLKNDVAPGGNKAMLTLANGAVIILDSAHNGILAQQGGSKVVKLNSGQLAYKARDKASKGSIALNTLATPRGGQYRVILPDGTKVWLNAASSLEYPTAFTGDERRVKLTGEGYFEVVQNASMPFSVTVNDITVHVLGTHFNVNAYIDEPSVKTTLLEGAVKITKGGDSKLLRPGQQADISRIAAGISVTGADIDEAVAWKEGLFHFEGDDMAGIMRKIARWYNVQVTYKDAVPAGHYTGIISRNTNLSEVLKVLELSGVHFKIRGRHLLVL